MMEEMEMQSTKSLECVVVVVVGGGGVFSTSTFRENTSLQLLYLSGGEPAILGS